MKLCCLSCLDVALWLVLPCVQDVSPKYNALMNLVSRGTKTYGERLSECAAMDNVLLRRSKQELRDMFPPSEQVRRKTLSCAQSTYKWCAW